MNLNEFSKILNKTLEDNNEKNINNNTKLLAFKMFLDTPKMKALYPNVHMYEDVEDNKMALYFTDSKENKFSLYDQKLVGVIKDNKLKFYHPGSDEGQRFAIYSESLRPLVYENSKNSATKIKNNLNDSSSFKDFIDKLEIEDINSVLTNCNNDEISFFELSKKIKENEIFTNNDIMKIMEIISDPYKIDRYSMLEPHEAITNAIANIIKNGKENDGYMNGYADTFFEFEGLSINDRHLTDEEKNDFYKNIVENDLAKNSLTSVLLRDPDNFIINAMDQIVFEKIKNSLKMKMELISYEFSMEQRVEQNPIVEKIMKEALKKDPELLSMPETFMRHDVINDKDIYDEEIGHWYLYYVSKNIIDRSECSDIILNKREDYYMGNYSGLETREYTDVIRFTGTINSELKYMLAGNIDVPEKNAPKILRINNYYTANENIMMEDVLNNVFSYCKKNNCILSLNTNEIKTGLYPNQIEILNKYIDLYKDEVLIVKIPEESNKRMILSKLNIPLDDIKKLNRTLDKLIEANIENHAIIHELESEVKSKRNKPKI